LREARVSIGYRKVGAIFNGGVGMNEILALKLKRMRESGRQQMQAKE
jgi:hypothetical protein